MMQPRAVDFVVYNVSDIERAVAFYRDTLGLPLTFWPGGPWAEFEIGHVTLSLCGTSGAPVSEGSPESPWPVMRWIAAKPPALEPPQPGGIGTHGGARVALAVHDVGLAVEELRRKGVPIVIGPEESPVCYMALIADPDGNYLWIHQRKDGTCGGGAE